MADTQGTLTTSLTKALANPSSLPDPSAQHAEGIEHIKANTDTSATEGAGVSSSADQDASQGGVIDTVKSYLGMGSGTGTAAAETGQLGTTGDGKNAQDTSGSGSGAGFTGTLASAVSAAGLGSGNQAAGGGLGSTSSSSAEATSENSGTTTGSGSQSTMEAAKEKVQEVTNTGNKGEGEGEERKESTSGDNDHKPPQPADGKPKKLENPSSIPTAGGEKLGEKHWGESGIVPDRPEPRASEAGISSEEGQPTRRSFPSFCCEMYWMVC